MLAAILSATFIDRSVAVPMQAATTAVVVATIIPPGSSGAMDRMVDALIGGVIGLLLWLSFRILRCELLVGRCRA